MRIVRNGAAGWAALIALVALYDVAAYHYQNETMSSAFRLALAHPRHRILVTLAWLMVTKHLFFGDLYPQLDPLHWCGHWLDAKKRPHIGTVSVPPVR